MECKKENGSDIDPAIEQQFPPPANIKRVQRHTARQIQEMEALFDENPHPKVGQRRKLSKELGLTPLQIKFWFQNRRTQIKVRKEREENAMLKAENEALKKESLNLQSELERLYCSSCRVGKLWSENSRLREEININHSIAYLMNHAPPPPPPPPSQDTLCFFPKTNNETDLSIAEEEKLIAMDLAVSCVQELTKMCDNKEPLWNKNINESWSLNEEEYEKMFINNNNNGDRFRREASKANSVVIMNSVTLVNAFLDADKWSEMFCSIVSKAKTIQIVSEGVSGASGSLLLMHAEVQALSPLIPRREVCFLRYAQQNMEQQKWIIVDFPIDRSYGLTKPASSTSNNQYRRKPSGCIIQEMPNGYSDVTWVEHVEVEEKHEIYQEEMVREYVKSGLAFSANRWLDVLKRQSERMVSLMATKITDLGVIPCAEARKNLMKLSQRMVRTFCLNIIDWSTQSALSESKEDTMRITTRKLHIGGGLVPCAVSTTFLPYSHHQVFSLLRHSQMFNENSLQEVAHIANGSNPGNCISLLRINDNNLKLVLQETCTDNSGSLVVASTVDVAAVQLAMNGEDDPSRIPLSPLGFSVVPLNPPEGISVKSPSCLLTIGIQVMRSDSATAKLDLSTVASIDNRICSTVYKITTALASSDRLLRAGDSVMSKQETNTAGN